MLIGLIGSKGAGKDTVADILVNYNWKKIAYATPIRNQVIQMLKLKDSDYDNFKRSTFTGSGLEFSGRDLLVGVGMLMRNHDENQFVNFVDKQISGNVVVTDVRFQNEIDHIISRGGTIVEVISNVPKTTNCITEALVGTNQTKWIIDNTGTIKQLNNEVHKVINNIRNEEQI